MLCFQHQHHGYIKAVTEKCDSSLLTFRLANNVIFSSSMFHILKTGWDLQACILTLICLKVNFLSRQVPQDRVRHWDVFSKTKKETQKYSESQMCKMQVKLLRKIKSAYVLCNANHGSHAVQSHLLLSSPKSPQKTRAKCVSTKTKKSTALVLCIYAS